MLDYLEKASPNRGWLWSGSFYDPKYVLQKNTHGSVFDTITRDTFAGIDVDVPEMDTQIKIAGILRDLDDKIELNTNINKNLAA